MSAQLRFEVFRFRKKRNPWICPHPLAQILSLRQVPHVFPHYAFRCEKSENSQLREPAEEKLLLGGPVKPFLRSFRMYMPAPEQSQPDVRIKEIQCVHRFVRW